MPKVSGPTIACCDEIVPLVVSTRRLGGEVFAGGGDGEFAVFDAFGGQQGIGHLPDAVGASPHREHFEAVVMVEMHVQCRNDQVAMIMLNVGEQFQQVWLVVVVDQCDGTRNFAAAELLLILDELGAHHVGDRLGTVFVSFGADQLIEVAGEFLVERDAESSDRFHPQGESRKRGMLVK